MNSSARLHAMRSRNLPVVAMIVLSSLLQVMAFPVAGPLPPWRSALAWLALVPLLWALLPSEPLTLRMAALRGYGCGVLWYAGSCYWVYGTMHTYGHLSVGMSALALVLMCLYLALYHALFGFLVGVAARSGRGFALLLMPLLWIAVELARARVTSFPWDLLGYTQIDNSILTAIAPFTGVYGISFLLALINAAIAAAVVLPGRQMSQRFALSAAVLAAGVQNAGMWKRPPMHPGSQKAVLLQPNLDVSGSDDLNLETLTASSARLSLQAAAVQDGPTRVVLWPESPAPYQTNQPVFTAAVTDLATQLQAPVIADAIGIAPNLHVPRGFNLYNSAVLFAPGAGVSGRYDKVHLVPFGEFVPYADLFSFASGLTQAVGTFDRGRARTPLPADGHRYGVFICYESIFGDEVRRFVDSGADVLVNLSDDGWYGDSSAPFQHINMARMRAIENRRWLLRDTNNGITASIDPNGTVVEAMPRNRRGAVAVHFDFLTAKTFYTRYGDVFAYVCTLLGMALLIPAGLKSSRQAVKLQHVD